MSRKQGNPSVTRQYDMEKCILIEISFGLLNTTSKESSVLKKMGTGDCVLFFLLENYGYLFLLVKTNVMYLMVDVTHCFVTVLDAPGKQTIATNQCFLKTT